MDLETLIQERARTVFGIQTLRPFQQVIIQRILEQDTPDTDHAGMVGILPTGGGKSLCFMLPSLEVAALTVIVYPLLSLMNDQLKRFRRSNIPCICIQGGQSDRERQQLFAQLDGQTCKVVVTNPECLIQRQVYTRLARHTISLLVLDEAHTIVRWGEGFRPALASMGALLAFLQVRQILCFTATADLDVLEGLNRLVFFSTKVHLVRANSDRPNITYHVIKTLSKDHVIATILAQPSARPAVVFCPTRDTTKIACQALLGTHPTIPARYYHAGLTKGGRKRLERWFEGQTAGVLFATNAFGMGVDKADIRTIIHRDVPSDALAYLQESGRAGRDGKSSQAFVLLDGRERSPLSTLFASEATCLRKALLAALGETVEFCSGCDVCSHRIMHLRQAEKLLLTAIVLHPFSYNQSSLASVVRRNGPGFANSILSTYRRSEVRQAIQLLVHDRLIRVFGRHRLLFPTVKGLNRLLTAKAGWKMLTHGTTSTRTNKT